MTDMRPVTSKARGICRFYNTSTGCFAGGSCKFLHGDETLTPYDKAKICKFYSVGYCKRGADCWFVHARPQAVPLQQPATDDTSEDDDVCCICFEKPKTYGLLGGCSHVFCLGCIREWRDPKSKSEDVASSGVTKKCPLCRAPSQYVIPSSYFCAEGDPRKATTVEKYKASMARVPCKWFEKSRKKYCPFGKDCFYQHLKNDGTPHIFKHGVAKCIRDRQYRELRRQFSSNGGSSSTNPPSSLNDFETIIASLRSLAASVTEAVARTSSNPFYSGFVLEAVDSVVWDSPDPNAHYALEDLGDILNASLLLSTVEELSPFLAVTDDQDLPQNPVIVSVAHAEEPARTVNGRVELLAPTVNNFLDTRSGQSTPTRHVSHTPEPFTTRPSSALSAPSRFSTHIPERAVSLLHGDVETVTAVPWAANNVLTTLAEPLNSGSSENRGVSTGVPTDTPVAEDTTPMAPPRPSIITHQPASPETQASVNAISDEDRAAALLQDTDPPFMTDGRGRVVWSSATAGSRARRGRTITTNSGGGGVAAPSFARDKPRVDPSIREHGSQTSSPAARPMSLQRKESETQSRQA